MNKKINLFLLILLTGLSSISVNSFAQTLSFRYSDPTIVAGSPMKFQYNVQIKASVTNTFLTSFTVRSLFNTTTFVGTSPSISVTVGSTFLSTFPSVATNPSVAGTPKYYTSSGATGGSGVEVSTSWVTLLTVTMDVLSPCDLAGLNFVNTYMNTRNKYKLGGLGSNINYTLDFTDTDANWTSKVLGYTAPTSTTWNGSVSSNWATSGNWTNGVPCTSTNVIVGSGTNALVIDQNVSCNNLTVAVGGKLTVNATRTVTLGGTFTIQSDASGTGSFINNGASALTATVERYISAYTSGYDGWRFVSSPVNGGGTHSFTAAAGEDFYSLDETLYLCWIYQSSPSFTNGRGYLVAYGSSGAKTFTGTLNNANVGFTNLSLTPSGQSGYQLLGNPFTSAITWSVGSWGLSNVNNFAYLLNGGGSYTSLSSGGIIPAMQGFLVQVSNTSNAITIPTDARTHSATNILNKSSVTERLYIKASSIGNSTYVESIIRTDNAATAAYDADLDANFLAGLNGVPQLYSKLADKKVSINTIPTIGSSVVSIPLSFVAGDATNYQLSFEGINTFSCSDITLQDLKTNTAQNLVVNPVYNFTALANDNENRFIIHFNSAVGVGEVNKVSGNIYSYGNDIFVNSAEAVKQISIYNTIGQLIYTVNNPVGLFKYSLNGNSSGYYIVKVITDKNVNSEKVFVK